MAQKEINCQGVSARMMELLYGELSGDDRATIEAHLAGCASCRAELAAFQSTRASARRALDADEPPARAHQAILRAAAAAVAAKQPKPMRDARRRAAAVVLGALARAMDAADLRHARARWPSSCWRARSSSSPTRRSSLDARRFDRPRRRRPPRRRVAAEPPAPAAARKRQAEKAATRPGREEAQGARRRTRTLQPSVANNAPARSIAAPATGAASARGARRFRRARRSVEGGRCRAAPDEPRLRPPMGSPSKMTWRPRRPPREAGQARVRAAASTARRARAPVPAAAANQSRERDTEGEALEEAAAAPRGSVGHSPGRRRGTTADPRQGQERWRCQRRLHI